MANPAIPLAHSEFLGKSLPELQAQPEVIGLAAGGSFVSPGLDEHSDLDLVIVVSDPLLPTHTGRRIAIAEGLGDLIACFTGEHVGEPRLLICLYAPALLHVDLKFVTLEGFKERVEDPAVLFDPSGELARIIQAHPGFYPLPDMQWAEDRFWIWIHYSAAKLRRGELLTAKQSADYILQRVIGPLLLFRAGAQPNQLRRLEQINPPELAQVFKITSGSDREAVKSGLETLVELYASLRASMGMDVAVNERAES
jgi:hypothetical protein